MQEKNVPQTYKGYKTEYLIKILEEIRDGGTKAKEEDILVMGEFMREYKIGAVHQFPSIPDTT